MNDNAKSTTFLRQMIDYGLKRIFWSFEFIVALAVFIWMVWSQKKGLGHFLLEKKEIRDLVVVLFAAASTLFSITLASLAIVLSLSSSKFVSYLRQWGKFEAILFPFWLGNASYLLVLLLSVFYLMLNLEKFKFLDTYFFPFLCSLFLYSVISTFYLLASLIRFGYYAGVINHEENRPS